VVARGRVLVVDDESNARTALAELLREQGYAVETAADGFKALPKLEEFVPQVLLADLKMPGLDGLELMRRGKHLYPDLSVVVMTAFGEVESAVAAMRAGAVDYLTKPLNLERLSLVLAREMDRRRLREETRHRPGVDDRRRLPGIIGQSREMRAVCETIRQVAPTRAAVLISGESGTGKELVAAALHELSPRAACPLVELHCVDVTDAVFDDGYLRQAHGGTLFFDEISELSKSTQVKLLRLLGDGQGFGADVRVVAATARDLLALAKQGRFREDLYYRLSVVTIETPALRSRPSDIPLLASHFLERFAAASRKTIAGFSDAALAQLAGYSWPGNVSELENAIEGAIVVSRSEVIGLEDLPRHVIAADRTDEGPDVPGSTLDEVIRHAILKTLEHTGGSTSRAAKILGIAPRTIQYKLQEYAGNPGRSSRERK